MSNDKKFYIIEEFIDDTAQDNRELEYYIYVDYDEACNKLKELAYDHINNCVVDELPFDCSDTTIKITSINDYESVDGILYNGQIIPLNNYKYVEKNENGGYECYCFNTSQHVNKIYEEEECYGKWSLYEYPEFEGLKKFKFNHHPCRYPYYLSIVY